MIMFPKAGQKYSGFSPYFHGWRTKRQAFKLKIQGCHIFPSTLLLRPPCNCLLCLITVYTTLPSPSSKLVYKYEIDTGKVSDIKDRYCNSIVLEMEGL